MCMFEKIITPFDCVLLSPSREKAVCNCVSAEGVSRNFLLCFVLGRGREEGGQG